MVKISTSLSEFIIHVLDALPVALVRFNHLSCNSFFQIEHPRCHIYRFVNFILLKGNEPFKLVLEGQIIACLFTIQHAFKSLGDLEGVIIKRL